jgi:hypothetical protein
MYAALPLIVGFAVLAVVVRRTAPGSWALSLGGAVAAAVTLCFVVARREAALLAGTSAAPRGWAAELLAGGAPLPQSPYLGLERIPALALWMLTWAVFLYGDPDKDEEPGPAILALVPPLLFVALLAFGPAVGNARSTAVVTLGLVAAVLTAVLIGRAAVRRVGRTRPRSGP